MSVLLELRMNPIGIGELYTTDERNQTTITITQCKEVNYRPDIRPIDLRDIIIILSEEIGPIRFF
ncbi:hypothetical protein BOW46_12280 [Solemya velum gill symbiont]|nr:hypothetical protein BOW08_12270 [Solemya velum gill symbiont]OOY92603.1 hypothetical protein BOW17_12305 [Solemya velum gill symbiont]OOY98759.1 hypothetical protein BOW20_11525 [Solemya velum gill symbiont]OOZ12047.1 hypothetical protein BOW27_11850 [Solemya velum gill symbiont]OOZ63615.1 hypothetical protein BOW46_12280 [Solemya velum gill symbiont]